MLLLLLLARGGFVIAATTITTRARLCSALVRELAGRTFPRQSYRIFVVFILLRRFLLLFVLKNKVTAERKLRFL